MNFIHVTIKDIHAYFFVLLLILSFAWQKPLSALSRTPVLFEIGERENFGFLSKQPGDVEVKSVDLNHSVLNSIASKQLERITIPVTINEHINVSIQKIIHFNNGGWSALGIIDDDSTNSVVLSYSPSSGKLISSIENVTNHSFYKIRFAPEINEHIIITKDPHQSDELVCGHNDDMVIGTTTSQSQRQRSEIKPSQNHGVSTIDVLIAYTPQALNWANANSSGINNIINQSMATAQLIADNSNVNIQFNLVHSQLVEYSETGNSITDLRRLTASPTFNPWGSGNAGYMDEIHQIRDTYSADLVALFTFTSDVGGIAWVINNENGLPQYGFSVSRVQQAAGRTHAHEMGHNFGNAHSRDQSSSAADANGGLFPYSTGWRWTGNDADSYASVMTYAEGSVPVNYFSNPGILYQGIPTGSYDGEFAPADNARSMNEIRHAVEDYRFANNQINLPSVTTTTISGISYSLIRVGGNVLADGGATVTQRGICWSKNQNPTFSDECNTIDGGLGTFEIELSGLDQNSDYFVRAFASNSAGTAFGEQKTFSTLKLQKPEAKIAESVNAVSFTANWTEVPEAERYFIDVSLDSGFDSFITGFENREVREGTTIFVDPLLPGTNYYYRVRTGAETTASGNSNIQQVSTTDISRTHSEVSLSRDRVLATGVQQSVITVQVQNSLAEPVYDADVTIKASGGSSTVSPNQIKTDNTGKAAFAITNNTEESIRYSVAAEGLTISDELEIEFLYSEGELTLGNNFPNPYNNQTQIPIVIPEQTRVRLDVYNSVGSLVQTIVDQQYNIGYYEIPFNAAALSSGVYFYRLVTDQGMKVEKMLLAK